jgi:hypothetical protein
VSEKVPAVVEEHDTFAVPVPVTLIGVKVPHARPVGTVSVSATLPEKPLEPAIAIVELTDCPAFTVGGELAVIAKSTKLNVADVE